MENQLQLLIRLAQIAGIAGLSLGVFFLLFNKVIRQEIVSRLGKRESFRVVLLFMVLVWSLAIVGIGAWVYLSSKQAAVHPGPAASPEPVVISTPATTGDPIIDSVETELNKLRSDSLHVQPIDFQKALMPLFERPAFKVIDEEPGLSRGVIFEHWGEFFYDLCKTRMILENTVLQFQDAPDVYTNTENAINEMLHLQHLGAEAAPSTFKMDEFIRFNITNRDEFIANFPQPRPDESFPLFTNRENAIKVLRTYLKNAGLIISVELGDRPPVKSQPPILDVVTNISQSEFSLPEIRNCLAAAAATANIAGSFYINSSPNFQTKLKNATNLLSKCQDIVTGKPMFVDGNPLGVINLNLWGSTKNAIVFTDKEVYFYVKGGVNSYRSMKMTEFLTAHCIPSGSYSVEVISKSGLITIGPIDFSGSDVSDTQFIKFVEAFSQVASK